MRPGNRVRQFG